ncbi:hemolysin XhlA family protein [Paenibacillus periandrae]|uniref:hemolysin XhlA family protein n=1 Tax=Paenibacillus periandrae TaxID=1761741 RepID=UPI001F09A484|nr:hemolysin XhlA family protein [Paenibacillus periandrae]
MPDDENLKITEQLTNVRLDLRELSTKMDTFKDMSRKIDEVDDLAKKAMESTKSAHRRLDRIDKLVTWLSTTVIGAIILAVVGFVIKGGTKP